MTQEDKQLLLKDLCARLPYSIWGLHRGEDLPLYVIDNSGAYMVLGYNAWFNLDTVPFKPYLRPMSSMTEDELRDFAKIKFENNSIWEIVEFPNMECYKGFINVRCMNKNKGDTWIFQVNTRTPLETYYGIDWLNAHHFDYRGLIEKGLALEAPEGMYK